MPRFTMTPFTILCLLTHNTNPVEAGAPGFSRSSFLLHSKIPSDLPSTLTTTTVNANSPSALNSLTASSALDVVGGGGSVSVATRGNADDTTEEEMILRKQEEEELVKEYRGGSNTTFTATEATSTSGYQTQEHNSIEYTMPRGIRVVHRPLRITYSNRKAMIQVQRRELRKQKQLARLEKRMERRRAKASDKSHREIAKKLKNRNHLNLSRKLWHASCGLAFASLNHFIPRTIFLQGMTVLTTGTLVMELLRYRKGFGFINDILHSVLGGSLRKHEMEGKFTGSFYYFLGVTVTAAMFPTSCATMGICQLALADPSASFFGRQTKDIYWSRIENGFFGIGRNKGVLGFLGGALFCLPFNYRVLSLANSGALPGGKSSVFLASLALGLAGAFADLCVPTPALTMPKKLCAAGVPPLHVDDNVVVPIFSGYACTKIFGYMGWTQGVNLAKCIVM